ncbi:MAG: alkaline phosphatase family protein [Candidatus Nanohaloarchaea archaeon]
MTELIVLGVDGVAPEYLERAIEEREVPGWERLMDEAFYTRLPSTVPAVTIPAWITMFSGYGPGKLDAYHLSEADFDEWEPSFPDSSRFQGRFFWDNMEKEVALHYVPGTTPAYPVNGVMRGGFPSPHDFDFSPEDLGEEFRDLERIDAHQRKTAKGKIQAEYHNFEVEREIADRFYEKNPEVWVSVIRMTDQVSHFAEKDEHVIDSYVKADGEVRKALERAEEDDANLIVVSDHGFFHSDTMFNISAFLQELGLQEVEEGGGESLLYRIAEPLLDTPLKKYMKIAHSYYKDLTGRNLSGKSDNVLEDVKKSSEVLPKHFGLGKDCVLKIHTEDMPHGHVTEERKHEIIDELEEELESLEKDGEKVVDQVWRGKELYGEGGPEIAFRTTDDFIVETAPASRKFSKTNTYTHREDGVFFAKGPDIEEEADGELEIADVAPLVYALLDEKVPRDIDGDLPEDLVPGKSSETRTEIDGIDF